MVSFEDISRARAILGLGETATAKQVKAAYRKLAKRHHPDKSPGADTKTGTPAMAEINKAYHILEQYLANYRYSFEKETFAGIYPEEEYHKRYTYGWFDGP